MTGKEEETAWYPYKRINEKDAAICSIIKRFVDYEFLWRF